MSNTTTETLSVILEREIAHPPEKIWRALTQPALIEKWLMKNDFDPVVGHRFTLRADWGAVDCQVLAIEPNKTLSYTWAAMGLESVVTWTLTATSTGSQLRMEQSGFRPDQQQFYQGADNLQNRTVVLICVCEYHRAGPCEWLLIKIRAGGSPQAASRIQANRRASKPGAPSSPMHSVS